METLCETAPNMLCIFLSVHQATEKYSIRPKERVREMKRLIGREEMQMPWEKIRMDG